MDILVACGDTHDGWPDPIHVVDEIMGWASGDTRKFVQGLRDRSIVELVPGARDGRISDPKACWKRGKALAGYSNGRESGDTLLSE
jgi:hypothetical protein